MWGAGSVILLLSLALSNDVMRNNFKCLVSPIFKTDIPFVWSRIKNLPEFVLRTDMMLLARLIIHYNL